RKSASEIEDHDAAIRVVVVFLRGDAVPVAGAARARGARLRDLEAGALLLVADSTTLLVFPSSDLLDDERREHRSSASTGPVRWSPPDLGCGCAAALGASSSWIGSCLLILTTGPGPSSFSV